MSRLFAALAIALLFAAAVLAQPAPRPLDPTNRVDWILIKIEERMKSADSILIEDCVRIDTDRAGSKTWKGELRFLKPNLFALRMVQQQDPRIFELMISTGKQLYEYRPQFRKLVIHELPPVAIGAFDKNILALALGTGAAGAKERYEFTITKDVSAANPDAVYLDVAPKSIEDKREFARAQLVLDARAMTPRRLWFEQPNGNTVEWRLPNFDTERKLTKAHFQPGPLPDGWEKVEIPLAQDPPPRRPGQ